MNKKHELRFRQVHLDFHTSPAIDGIGSEFDKKLWQERLQMAHVDSITCFSCCQMGGVIIRAKSALCIPA